jgi:hypothetical protein
MAGLAMIIGAFVTGLALSRTDVAEDIREKLEGLYAFIVPIFFCVSGMMVDFSIMPSVLVFGLAYAILGILGKIIGSGIPALFTGFNIRGAFRIGAGMLPRGEVTLIMAGIGLSGGVIGRGFFGVAVMSVLVTSIVSPPLLVGSFRGGSGYRKKVVDRIDRGLVPISFNLPTTQLADFVLDRFIAAFRREEFFPRRVGNEKPVYALMKDRLQITLAREETKIAINTPPDQEAFVRLLVTEELLSLKELLVSVEELSDSGDLERDMLGSLFVDSAGEDSAKDDET